MRRTRAVRLLAVILGVVGAYRLRKSELGISDIKGILQDLLRSALARVVQLWALIKEQVHL
jgi:hypothetical protein